MNKKMIWYLGYGVSVLIVYTVCMMNASELFKAAGCVLASIIFSISHVQLLHEKMLREDHDYRIAVKDERNMTIKEKAGNLTNVINVGLLGIISVVFFTMDYVIPAIVVAILLLINPFIMILISNRLEKKV